MIADLGNQIGLLMTRMNSIENQAKAEVTRINDLERALPERLHNCEARQANHIELVNQLSNYMNVQLAAVDERLKKLEDPRPGTPPPQGGGGGAQVPDQFNIGSPTPTLGGNSPPQQPPQPDPWAESRWGDRTSAPQQSNRTSAHHPNPPVNNPGAHVFNNRDWSVTEKKVSKALQLFDGSALRYRNWAGRVKDHFKEVNINYALIFDLIEKAKTPIPIHTLNMFRLENGIIVDMRWIAQHLWTFIGKNVNDSVHERRLTLTQNEEDNGIELWRSLFIENEGGSEQVELGGMASLHAFPQCPSMTDLQHWIGQWQITRLKFGRDLPESHLRQMFLNMLPNVLSSKLRERKDLSTLQQYIDEVNGDLGRLNDGHLARIQSQRMKNSLQHGPKNPVNAVVEEHRDHGPHSSEGPTTTSSAHDELSKKLDGLIAALNDNKGQGRGRGTDRDRSPGPKARSASPRDRRPDSRFKGCLHCGDTNHFRRDCPEFKEILKKNDGKLPKDYKGKYERWKENQKKKSTVAAISDLSDEDEFPETTEMWALPCIPCPPTKTLAMPISLQNAFQDLTDVDEHDDEDEVLEALKQLTSKVQVGPKPSQQQRRQKGLSKARIAHIAREVNEGRIHLPDLNLDNDGDYEAIWALVDSGAGRSCARKSQHVSGLSVKNEPSDVRMSTASGQELRSRGKFKVQAITAEGNSLTPEFEDADVDMPIVAVTDISRNGKAGTEVCFRNNGGDILDVTTQKRSAFVRRRGVYFMKLFYKKNQCSKPNAIDRDFTRPGKP